MSEITKSLKGESKMLSFELLPYYATDHNQMKKEPYDEK